MYYKWTLLTYCFRVVSLCVHPSVISFFLCSILRTMHARVLKFHIWIPHGKITDLYFYTPPHNTKWQGIMLYSPNCLSVRASALRFWTFNLSSFWPIFFKLCMDIDIREEWFGIANGLNLFINNRVMALDWCKNVFFLNIFRTNRWILINFSICIDIYKIHIVSNACYFWSIFNRVMALDWQNFVYAQYLVN